MRFVIGAAQPIAGAVAAIFVLGGLASACARGGFAGFVSFIVTLLLGVVIYVAIHVWIETLRVFVDIERNSRELLHATRESPASQPPGSASSA
jgi:hypothetical protein